MNEAVCPVCHNNIKTINELSGLVEFTCPSCSCKLSADKNAVQKYGIVNTSSAEWDKLKNSYNYDRLSKPYNDKDENVLMMYNSGAQTLSYTSDTKNLSANANYTFMMDVQPQYGNLTIELVCTVDGNEIVLASYEAEQIVAAYNWQTVRFNIKTGYQPLNVAIRFTIKNASTYAYVDNVYYNYTTYGVNNIKNVEVDLSEITNFFTGAENKQIAFKGKFNLDETGTTPNLHINPSYASTLSNIQTAIADEDKDYEINKNAIGICTNNFNSGAEEQDTYYTLKSSLGFNLDSSNYYKIVIYVFTAELNSSKEDVKQEDIGASIGLTSFDSKFTNIQTGENWEKYAFYIKPSSTVTSYLEFSLGSEATPCTGKAFFANIIFDPIEEDEFNKFDNTANANVKVLNQVTTNNDADTDTDDNNTDNEEQNNNSQAWIYAIPSILFAIAIVICVVGVMARKVKWKKPSRKTKNDYDRNRTVSKQYYSRKATQLREEKLTDLNKQLNNLIAERTKFEEDYKKDLNKLRQLKINRAPAAEINALDKDMRKNRRLSANVGVNINKVNGEIEFTKSEQYLNMLIKKLSNEAKTSNVVEESEKADANTTNKENEKK